MASWSESASYQGAASGAAVGSLAGPEGTAIGAGVGFVAGGLIGGSQEDDARKAEEERQKEIQRAIERQNTADFNAKAQAEQWAIADIGINKDDRVQDAMANNAGLQSNAAKTDNLAQRHLRTWKADGVTADNWYDKKAALTERGFATESTDKAVFDSRTAKSALDINEGIIASYQKDMGAPKKY